MTVKKAVFIFAILFLFCNYAEAGELAAKEGVNYYNQGVQAQKSDNFTGAELSYKKVLLLDPGDPTLRKYMVNNMGVMYFKQGDLDSAERAFNMALEIDPDYKPAKLNLGLVYEKRRTRCESLEYWAKMFDFEKLKPTELIMEGPVNKE